MPPNVFHRYANMPRKFVAKGLRQTDRTALEEAFNYRVRTECSIRAACNQYDGVKAMTLQVRKIIYALHYFSY